MFKLTRLIYFFIFMCVIHIAQAEPENINKAKNLIQQLEKVQFSLNRKKDTFFTASAAADELKNFNYTEVINALFEAVKYEFNDDIRNPNSFIVSKSLESLAVLVSKDFATEVAEIETLINLKSQNIFNNSTSFFNNSLEIIKDRLQTDTKSAPFPKDQKTTDSKNLDSNNPDDVNKPNDFTKWDPKKPSFVDQKNTDTDAKTSTETSTEESSEKSLEENKDLVENQDAEKDKLFTHFLEKEKTEITKALLIGTQEVLTDRFRTDKDTVIYGRQKEAEEGISILSRIKSKAPVFVGPAGSGKTAIVERLAQIIINKEIPNIDFIQKFNSAEILLTSPGRISSLALSNDATAQGAALELYINSVLSLQKETGKAMIVFIDEIHTLNQGQIEALKPFLSTENRSLYLIGATTSEEFNLAFKDNEAFLRRLQQIGVIEFSIKETIEILNIAWKDKIQNKYLVQFSEESIKKIATIAVKLFSHGGRLDASIKTMMDLAIWQRFKTQKEFKKDQAVTIDKKILFKYIAEKHGYPVDPSDNVAVKNYLHDLKLTLNQNVMGQNKATKALVELWGDLLQTNGDRSIRVALSLGSTGVGKTYLAQEMSKIIFPGQDAVFRIDGNTFKEGSLSMNTLLGVPPGVLTSNSVAGAGSLMKWLDDPARGGKGGIIIIDEAERAHIDFWEKLMEFFDRGIITGNDGKTRTAKNIIVLLTSNRADSMVFPSAIKDWSDQELKDHIDSFSEEKIKNIFKEKISGRDTFQLPDPILARIDKFTIFSPINKNIAAEIAKKWSSNFSEKYLEDKEAKLSIDEKITKYISEYNFNISVGVRKILRNLESFVLSAVRQIPAEWTAKEINFSLATDKDKEPSIKIEQAGEKKAIFSKLPFTKEVSFLEQKDIILNLPKQVEQDIFGQNELVKNIGIKILSHKLNPKRPLSFFLVGLTGTGKTEIWKSIAKHLYGKASRAKIIPLGNIIYDGSLNNIFGSPKGHAGSTDISIFEQFLIDNPKEGIVVFDEASNVGGKDKASKNQIFKTFYDLIEEGVWTSPSTGKSFNLSKYIIAFTGNDGENLFKSYSHDDMLKAVWKNINNRKALTEILIESGVPQAFLGRIGYIAAQKPLSEKHSMKIVNKFLEPTLNDNKDWAKFTYSENFLKDFFNTFFSHDQGVRSIKSIIEEYLPGVLFQARLQIGSEKIANLKLSLKDNLPKKPYIPEDFTERVVEIIITKENGEELFRSNLSEQVDPVSRPTRDQARLIAFHEAGHAVANDLKITRMKVNYITIYSGKGAGGYTRYEPLPGTVAQNRTWITHKVAVSLAGGLAQKKAGYELDTGMGSDYEGAKKTIEDFIKSGALMNTVNVLVKQQTNKEKNIIFEEAKALSEKILEDKWSSVERVAEALLKNGFLLEADFDKLINNNKDDKKNIKPTTTSKASKTCKIIF